MTNSTPTPLDLDALEKLVNESDRWVGTDKTILRALISRAREADELQRERAALYDKLNGTPCAEIRWRQERELLIEALEPFARIGRYIEQIEVLKEKGQLSINEYGKHFCHANIIITQLREAIK